MQCYPDDPGQHVAESRTHRTPAEFRCDVCVCGPGTDGSDWLRGNCRSSSRREHYRSDNRLDRRAEHGNGAGHDRAWIDTDARDNSTWNFESDARNRSAGPGYSNSKSRSHDNSRNHNSGNHAHKSNSRDLAGNDNS
jgi:hypothetical protein